MEKPIPRHEKMAEYIHTITDPESEIPEVNFYAFYHRSF